MSTYAEDLIVEQPAVQLMQHELGWDVVNCYDDPPSLKLRRTGWSGDVSNQGRAGKREGENIEHRTPNIEHRSEEKRKRRTNPALQRLNPDLPMEAIEGAVEERGILNDEFWILNGRGRRQKDPCRRRFLISLEATFSPFAETDEITEIERLQNFTESTNFTTC